MSAQVDIPMMYLGMQHWVTPFGLSWSLQSFCELIHWFFGFLTDMKLLRMKATAIL